MDRLPAGDPLTCAGCLRSGGLRQLPTSHDLEERYCKSREERQDHPRSSAQQFKEIANHISIDQIKAAIERGKLEYQEEKKLLAAKQKTNKLDPHMAPTPRIRDGRDLFKVLEDEEKTDHCVNPAHCLREDV